MQFAKLNSINLHYQEIGGPEGTPNLVFINSLGTDFRIWRDVIVRFVGEASILTYDKRGHGLSDVGNAPYTIEDHAEDLAALLDHVGKKDVILVGVSVGGLIAQALYKTRPDLIKAMVLCDTAAKIGTASIWGERIELLRSEGMGAAADASVERWFEKVRFNSHGPEIDGYRTMVARQPLEGYMGTCAAIRDADFTSDAAAISAPTMCVVGLNDKATTPEHVFELSQLISGSRYEEIEDAGHLPFIEQPDQFARLLKDFIKDINASATEGEVLH